MQISDKVVVVTGAAGGIGAALAQEAVARGAKFVAVADLNIEGASAVAAELGESAKAYKLDVTSQSDVDSMVADIEAAAGPVDLYISNAGVLFMDLPDWTAISQTDQQWETAWGVNVYAHIRAARAVLPKMLERKSGGFVITASAAGLLSLIGDTAYSATKHAAVGLAESMAITHGEDGIYVGVLCPQAVKTDMIAGAEDSTAALDGIKTPADVAAITLDHVEADKFMIRPHEQVNEYVMHKAQDHDQWVAGMRKLRKMVETKTGRPA